MVGPAVEDANKRTGKWMFALAWVAFLVVMTVWFDDALMQQINPNQEPVSRVTYQGAEVTLKQNRYGHYVSGGDINGQDVTFLLDTGATQVSIPARLGEKLGLRAGAPQRVMTANGSITVYQTQIDKLALGDIVLYDVRANLNPGMNGEEILLGMSALRNLEFTQRSGTLTLKLIAD